MSVNVWVIRLSRGRLGSQLGTQSILLLHTLGHLSGKKRVVPVAYFLKDGFYFLVGSNWGKPHNAGWYHNLLAHPITMIEVKGKTIQVSAHPAQGSEYEQLWQYAVDHHPPYQHYREMTHRSIPIMVLQPI